MSQRLVKYVRGIPFPSAERFSVENITAALDHVPIDEDILICSFPKAGTTWMQCVIWQILHRCAPYPTLPEFATQVVPFIERAGVEPLKSLTSPRFYKTHIPYDAMKINKKAKYIYIYRHPADTLVSYFHFMRNRGDTDISLDEFFEYFLEGNIPFGNYIDHVMPFYKYKNDPHVLLVSYEEMSVNKRGQLLRVAKFLGEKYYEDLVNDEDLIQRTLEVTSFDYMKKTLSDKAGEIPLFRKGVVGDGDKSLSATMKERLRVHVQEKTKGTDLSEVWGM